MNIKKIIGTILICFGVVGCAGGMGDGCCGYTKKDQTGSGQVKKVGKISPLICPDYYQVDLSLGVMRNGVGSMSHQDITLAIDDRDVKAMKAAAEAGAIIDFTYDTRRVIVCVEEDRLSSFKVVDK